MRISRFAATVLAGAMLAATPAGAGTAESPELVDPAGDVNWFDADGSPAGWADLTAAWLTTVRDDDGAVAGFTVSVRTAEAPAEQMPDITAYWRLSDGCYGDVWIRPSAIEYGAGGAAISSPAGAWMDTWCEGDEGTLTLGPLSMRILRDTKDVGFERAGAVYTVTIPTAVVEGTKFEPMYAEGATLRDVGVSMLATLPFVGVGVDWSDCYEHEAPGCPDYVLGS